MSMKCRVWWPKHLSSSEFLNSSSSSSSSSSLSSSSTSSSSRSLLLFGWFISCSSSCVDVVVAFAFPEEFLSLRSSDSAIQEAIHHANGEMPVTLQKSSLTVLGRCVLPFENTDHTHNYNMIGCDKKMLSKYAEAILLNGQLASLANPRNISCGCLDYDGLLKQERHASLCRSSWIQLVHDACSCSSAEIGWIPTLDHLHWNGKLLPLAELHVTIYETPRYGSHHFSINFCSSKTTKCPTKRPKWVEDLYHKPQRMDLDAVILAINCSAAANMYFCKHLGLQSSSRKSVLYMYLSFIWRLWATIVATFSTFLYVVFQLFSKLVGRGSTLWIFAALTKLFANTWRNIQVRCHQFLYWPIVLDETGLRSEACVEYAEKAGLQRHSFWDSAAIDVLLGNLVGFALLIHVEAVLTWFSTFAIQFTDEFLRTGCVWLMGVPAGFKLNTELAGVFGIIFLNVIHMWSTVWFSAADIFSCLIKVVAVSGILLGMTISVALFSDMVAIAVFHIKTIQYVISLLYSLQIQALTALWRLFRGRKWNPLRQRLDSYKYSVEQHVVGSLLFTPLLLLLPTTSVFYIYFSMMNLTVTLFLTVIEIIISIIHDTPYSKILLWLVRSKRFPSGIWFESIHCRRDASSVDVHTCYSIPQDKNINSWKPVPMLSLLRSNFFSFGQVVFPHYKNICSGFHGLTLRSAISGILTGKSNSTTRCSVVPPEMPWMSVSYKDYWYNCYNAVLACMQ